MSEYVVSKQVVRVVNDTFFCWKEKCLQKCMWYCVATGMYEVLRSVSQESKCSEVTCMCTSIIVKSSFFKVRSVTLLVRICLESDFHLP